MEQGKRKIKEFTEERARLNALVLEKAGLKIKRFYSLDSQVYRKATLPEKTLEMLGLVSSFVLRCDDCIYYHLKRCYESGLTDEELSDILSVGLVVGGSITIPHLRRAYDIWEELKFEERERDKED